MKYLSSLLLPGGIVLLATSGWFSGQHTVGLVMVIFGSIGLVIALVILCLVALAMSDPTRVPPGVRKR